MSRREVAATILVLLVVTVAGFIFGRVILPRVFKRIMDTHLDSDAWWDKSASSKSLALEIKTGTPAKDQTDVNPYLEPEADSDANSDSKPQSDSDLNLDTNANSALDSEANSADMFIDVDVTAQVVRVMKGEEVLKEMIASTGSEGHETPLGTFEIQNRGTWFYSDKYKQGAKYWVSFRDWGVYLFHSVVMDKNQTIIKEEEEKLGQPVSHGCIRLNVEDAKWIYDNVPEKTKVVIRE